MRDSTGARVIFPAAEDRDQDLITIIGKEGAVREAQKELEALIRSLVRPGGGRALAGGPGVPARSAGRVTLRPSRNAAGQRG